jgi:NAD(P)-dependent dehydrogenase (short-subunit alcohol dehydrogenase family)
MLLDDKVAIVYGATGAIGGAVARAFAAEGARVHVTGRDAAALDALAAQLGATAAQVDALDDAAITDHINNVGDVDISFNAIGTDNTNILGVPLMELDAEHFSRPIADYTRSYFLTARAAARAMVPRGSGVIMTLTALPGVQGSPRNGGYGPASAAKEQMTRDLSLELAPRGIRVVGVRPHGIPESGTMRDIYDIKSGSMDMSWEQFTGYLASTTHARRTMTLDDVAGAAAFLASDRASGLTGTTLNLTLGGVPG